jgi:hypothetical protein
MQILAGLNMSPVVRLKESWESIPEKYMEILKSLDELMSSKINFKTYRSELASITESHKTDDPPILPYLGIYLRDLTFMDDGNPDYIEGLLNFDKIRMIGATLAEIKRYQNQPNLVISPTDEDPLIYNFLVNLTIMDDESLFERSKSKTRRSLVFS